MYGTNAAHLARTRFHALGTDVLIVSPAADRLDAMLRADVDTYEHTFSRFLPDSELERLNARAGRPTSVSPHMFEVLRHAQGFWRETDGIFDPLVRSELEAAGYDRTFAAVPRRLPDAAQQAPARTCSFGDVRFGQGTVTLPAHARLDLGGIAKGWIVDRLAGLLAPHGPFIVDIGGDIAARGAGPGSERGWRIGVADPFRTSDDLCTLDLVDGAIATSTTSKRRWRRGDELLHHLIDPRTGRPAAGDLVQVTVLASTTMAADVYAKTALIKGHDAGFDWLSQRGLPALLVTQDATSATARWPAPSKEV